MCSCVWKGNRGRQTIVRYQKSYLQIGAGQGRRVVFINTHSGSFGFIRLDTFPELISFVMERVRITLLFNWEVMRSSLANVSVFMSQTVPFFSPFEILISLSAFKSVLNLGIRPVESGAVLHLKLLRLPFCILLLVLPSAHSEPALLYTLLLFIFLCHTLLFEIHLSPLLFQFSCPRRDLA